MDKSKDVLDPRHLTQTLTRVLEHCSTLRITRLALESTVMRQIHSAGWQILIGQPAHCALSRHALRQGLTQHLGTKSHAGTTIHRYGGIGAITYCGRTVRNQMLAAHGALKPCKACDKALEAPTYYDATAPGTEYQQGWDDCRKYRGEGEKSHAYLAGFDACLRAYYSASGWSAVPVTAPLLPGNNNAKS